jgi:hypothetical protein
MKCSCGGKAVSGTRCNRCKERKNRSEQRQRQREKETSDRVRSAVDKIDETARRTWPAPIVLYDRWG